MIYYLARFLLGVIIKCWLGLEVKGVENIPERGPAIVAANHKSHLDPVVLGIAVPRPVHYMAKAELFSYPFFGALLSRLKAFPVRRGGADRAAIRRACSILQEGKVLGLFPEGRRMPSGKLGKAKRGLDLLVKQTDAPVVPVAINGTDRVLPPGARWLRRHRIQVNIGKPIVFSRLSNRNDDHVDMENSPGAVIMKEISSLMQDLHDGARK